MKPVFLMLMIAVIAATFVSCEKDFLSGDAQKNLFTTPTTAELDNVFNGWKNKNIIPADYQLLQEADVIPGTFKLKIVSFRVNGIKEYGALIIPNNTANTVPVQMYVGGFGLNITTNSVNVALDTQAPGSSTIIAIPALRGQSLELTINGKVYTTPISEGEHCDAFDGATDDVLAFLNLVQQTEAIADVNRTGVRGGSRGGTVAMLAGIRDTRVKLVIAVVSPTDMLALTAENQNDDTYRCQFLSAYKNGQRTLEETRNKIIASSPLYFAQYLPLTQLHLGSKDANVPVSQGYALQEKLAGLSNASKFQLYTYDKTHFDIATNNPDLTERIKQFFAQL
ncbi:MAG TPA: prolyl oligopeptidase family serine peptidase [Phnomibacter sp.]|nr:prolyl oligopeptidase family serine peptidase [Phnomibacter sp.]